MCAQSDLQRCSSVLIDLAASPYLDGPAVTDMQERLGGVKFLGLDRWGNAGRAKEPFTGHFDPRIDEE